VDQTGILGTKPAAIVFLLLAGLANGHESTGSPFGSRRGSSVLDVEPISLPTQRFSEESMLWRESDPIAGQPQPLPAVERLDFTPLEETRPDWRRLARPTFSFGFEWEPETGGLAIGSYDARVTVPTFPIFGPPPPMITAGFSFTDLHAPESFDLPSSLYDISLGITGMRKLDNRWMIRWMISSAFASDWENTTSDAWQFRGGAFVVWNCSEQWQITLGALATGREDIPVLPAAGAIWQPGDRVRVDLMMPRPRVSFMVADRGSRQHWIYAGGGLDGGTWAYQRASGLDELLTYREWRLVLGWEAKPPGRFGGPPTPGLKLGTEIGYVIGRTFEFNSAAPDIKPDNALLLRASVSF
jgi:hypothetical protein